MTYVGTKAYTQTEVATADPLKLILLLYDAGIRNLFKVRDAIKTGDVKARGEHLGKAMEIIGELINSLRDDPEDEAVAFLHGLYMSMLKELGKVPLTNDISTVELAIKYFAQLRTIWKEQVMGKANLKTSGEAKEPQYESSRSGAVPHAHGKKPVSGHSASLGVSSAITYSNLGTGGRVF